MTHARFTDPDPDLQAVYAYLAPADTSPAADSAEAVAAREGLNLADDLAAVRRRAARLAPARRRTDGAARRGGRRSLQAVASTLLSGRAPHLRRAGLQARARAWAQLGLWPDEMEAWISAVGVDGAAIARACLDEGIALTAMDVVLDGGRVKSRLRGGETAASVRARAQRCGRSLSA
ncbi:hypothetical protein [Streptomyces sp. B1-3]|uniref:hypothetical protein n=1 Tax=Streptomyces sp. B1-3 TaxID=3141453 RepID=UPI003D2D5A9E